MARTSPLMTITHIPGNLPVRLSTATKNGHGHACNPGTVLNLDWLEGINVNLSAVAAGFPHGLSPLKQRLEEIKASVDAGAKEIDIVITRGHVLTGNWNALYDEVKAFREACGEAHLKSILATGELATLRNVAKASMVAMMAGSDFIKTS